MQTWTDIFFYAAFLGQMFLISYHFPKKILARMRFVLETYPPAQYPKLYPRPLDYYRFGHRAYRRANQLILGLGFVILLLIAFVVDHSSFADDGFISEFWPMLYGAIQFAPLIALEFSELSQFRLMRKINKVTTRKAELYRRRLLDFVSPKLLIVTVACYLGAILFDLYVHDFVVRWDHDTMQRAMALTGTLLFFCALGAWQLYGRKQNPHQAHGDRVRQISAQLHSMLYVSIVLSGFMMVQAADDIFDLDFLDATLFSIYFQLIALLSIGLLLRSIKLEDVNFDVYKGSRP